MGRRVGRCAAAPHGEVTRGPEVSPSPNDHTLALPDGRNLGYALYGDPAGAPVLNCHGGLVSGHDVSPADEIARAMGVWVISPDRPGVNRTDRRPGYTMRSWVASDLVPLLSHLEVDRFAVMGWSEGGQYALSATFVLGERISACAVIAGCPPLDDPDTLQSSNRVDHAIATLARRAPAALRCAFRGTRVLAHHAPRVLLWASVRDLPAPEAAAVIGQGHWFATLLGEGAADPRGVVDEYLAVVKPWGFAPEDIKRPVHIFQGTADTSVPARWGTMLAERIPGAFLTLFPGEGHFISLTRRRDVLEWLVRNAGDVG